MNRKILFRFFIGVIILPIVYIESDSRKFSNERMMVTLGSSTIRVEIANTQNKRSIGLMHRTFLGKNEGMLFVFPHSELLSFWMKNTKIPLSIGYFDQNGILLEIHNMKPNQTDEIYNSKKEAIYALEVNQGWFHKNGILPGTAIVLEKAITGY